MEFSFPIRVYYEDTDAGGVVYHANYLNYCERARTEMLRAAGFEQDCLIKEDDLIFAVRSIQVDYLKPARFNNELIVNTHMENYRKTSMTFAQTVCHAGENEPVCRLQAVVVCVSATRLKPRAIPMKIIQKLETDSAD